MTTRPDKNNYHPFYQTYLDMIPDEMALLDALDTSSVELNDLLVNLDEDHWSYQYGPDKWSVKESLNHIIDTERVFAFRALWIARGNEAPLPGFDQNDFAANSDLTDRQGSSLLDEFKQVRASTKSLLQNFSAQQWLRIGTTSDHRTSVKAIGFMIAGHALHHVKLYKERYKLKG